MHVNGGSYSLFKLPHDKAVLKAQVMSRVIGLITTTLSVGVSTDGWTNIRSNGLHNCMVGDPIPYLFKSVCTPPSNEDVNMLYGIAS
eukprot:10845705-Ditylum_brightwellii.AAC.1